ncbi:MAG: hypothetical protein V5B60_01040 [Accumulibacter sp.]|jgi:hypothetical protein|uniref:hypothetical protein n=1 Tax=Accumulibacter sp. TaxID=2053492 RepID=UPI002FC3889B
MLDDPALTVGPPAASIDPRRLDCSEQRAFGNPERLRGTFDHGVLVVVAHCILALLAHRLALNIFKARGFFAPRERNPA